MPGTPKDPNDPEGPAYQALPIEQVEDWDQDRPILKPAIPPVDAKVNEDGSRSWPVPDDNYEPSY